VHDPMKEDEGGETRWLQCEGVLLDGDTGCAVGGKGDAFGLGRGVDAGRHGLLAAGDKDLDAVAVQLDAEADGIALAVHGTAAKVYDSLMEPCLAPVKDEPPGARLIGKGGRVGAVGGQLDGKSAAFLALGSDGHAEVSHPAAYAFQS